MIDEALHERWVNQNPLKKWIDEKNYTMAKTASIIGVSTTSIYNWITGASLPEKHWKKLAFFTREIDLKANWAAWHSSCPGRKDENNE